MTDKKKFIFSNLLSFVLGIVIGAGGFGIVSNINKNEKVPEQTATLPDSGGAVIGEAQENGIQMMKTAIPVEEYAAYGVSEQAEKAYTITATVKPDDVSNKNIKWNLSFKNASSTWAQGKKPSDYVTVTASGTTNNTAVLTCKQAFGEQILLTAVSEYDSSKSAVCTVDYEKKLTGFSATYKFGASQSLYSCDFLNDSKFVWAGKIDEVLAFNTPQAVYSDYTIDNNIQVSVKYKIDKELLTSNFFAMYTPGGLSDVSTYERDLFPVYELTGGLLSGIYIIPYNESGESVLRDFSDDSDYVGYFIDFAKANALNDMITIEVSVTDSHGTTDRVLWVELSSSSLLNENVNVSLNPNNIIIS